MTTIKPQQNNDDDDDIMDIVKPVVIVGSIVLVLVGVFVYIMYKRRKYIKEQKERKISEAQAPLPGWMNHAARSAAKMSTVTILSEDVLYEQPNEISIKADALANHNKAFDEDEEDSISNKSTNDQNNKDNTTNHIHNNNNNGSIKKDDSPKIEDVELKESPKTNNISNGHVVTPLKDGSVDSPFDQLQETQISNDTVDSPLDHTEETLIPDDTVIHIPDNDDNDDNDSDSEIGEPIGNSTRQSDEDKDEDAKTMVHDISGSSLPSLSGSLVNDDFFGQMMNEYDRINTLPRK
uniref:Uncharacterized protein n=1 Tax=Clytia hemisphaerica TaxID=252671 RepID=A0A7M5XBS8_9CNID